MQKSHADKNICVNATLYSSNDERVSLRRAACSPGRERQREVVGNRQIIYSSDRAPFSATEEISGMVSKQYKSVRDGITVTATNYHIILIH